MSEDPTAPENPRQEEGITQPEWGITSRPTMSADELPVPSVRKSRRSRFVVKSLGVLVGVFLLATAGKVFFNVCAEDPWFRARPIPPAWSPEEARRRGMLIAELEPAPAEFELNGHTIAFQDMWIEKMAEKKHFLVWWSYYEPTGDHTLCFRLHQGGEAFAFAGPEPEPALRAEVNGEFAGPRIHDHSPDPVYELDLTSPPGPKEIVFRPYEERKGGPQVTVRVRKKE
jgi:hypothetical protein